MTVVLFRLGWKWREKQNGKFGSLPTRHNPAVGITLRASIAETLLVLLIKEQGGKEIQHEEHEDILSGPVRRAQ